MSRDAPAAAEPLGGLNIAAPRRISTALTLDEPAPPYFARAIVVLIALALGLFLAWAARLPLKEIAVGAGEIMPGGFARQVQHLEGGALVRLLVEENSVVVAGQVIAVMDDGATATELRRLETEASSLRWALDRLAAIARGGDAVMADVDVGPGTDRGGQRALFEAQRESLRAALARIDAKIKASNREEQALRQRIERTIKEVALIAASLERRAPLMANGLMRMSEFEQIERESLRVQSQLADAQAALERERYIAAELAAERDEVLARLRETALVERAERQADLDLAEAEIARLSDRLERTQVRAPISGVVKNVAIRAPAVIGAGGLIAEIVPHYRKVFAEVRVRPQDIGHVAVGLDADVQVSAYDHTRFGALAGRVEAVSPAAFIDERGEPYFNVHIGIDEPQLAGGLPVTPGMTVRANIVTGERTLLQYLLRPVRALIESPLSEP